MRPEDAVTEAQHLMESLRERRVRACLLGGLAVALRCPSARKTPLIRTYHDFDLATERSETSALASALEDLGYVGAERFNALHGHSRMMFSGPEGRHIDVLVDRFVMCHELDLRGRLAENAYTLPLSDLLLTKLQIAQVNHKDILDITSLLLDHPVSVDESGIESGRIVKLLSADWGWWRTVTENLAILAGLLPTLGLSNAEIARVQDRVTLLEDAIRDGKRSVRWRARARIGDRMDWRLEPEEVAT